MVMVVAALVAGPANALTLGDAAAPAAVSVESFALDQAPAEVAAGSFAFADDGSAVEIPGVHDDTDAVLGIDRAGHGGSDGNATQLLYYVSDVLSGAPDPMLARQGCGEAAAAESNPVPEPTTGLMLLSGLGGLGVLFGRRRTRS